MRRAGPRAWAAVLLLLALLVAPAAADVRDFIGRPLITVRVEVAGEPTTDPAVLQLIETRVGDPLSMERIRESIDHLVGLGRFEDIRVFAEAANAPPVGVALRWSLVPVRRITDLRIDADAGPSASALRTQITERVGATPVTARVADVVQVVRAEYARQGYRNPAVEPRLVPLDSADQVALALEIAAGSRTTIRQVSIQGDTRQPDAALLRALDLERGQPYDAAAIDERVEAFEQRLHDDGYYEARVELTPTYADTAADLVLNVIRGPRVRVVFGGDPLPENRRDTLVPIREERSVDLDLLEDASRNIETFLRQQGYRAARAPYTRLEQGDELVLTFTVDRGPLHRLASLDVTGLNAVSRADLTPLLVLKPGEPFADSRVATVASAVTELYRVRGFAGATVTPEIVVRPAQQQDGQTISPVAVTLAISEGLRTLVGEVRITGADALAAARITPLLGLTTGRPFYRPQLDADRDAIERIYQNEGFQNVRVQPRATVRDDGQVLDVEWNIAEGPRVFVDRVLVNGNDRTSADLIRREIVLAPGDALGAEALIESQRRLAALGLFRRVRIVDLPHAGRTTRDILIDVEEAPATTISYGGGLEAGRRLRTAEDDGQAEERIDIAPRGFFEVSRRNLWGKNRSVSLFTRVSLRPRDPAVGPDDPGGVPGESADPGGYGFNEYRFVATFREPRLLDRPGDVQFTAFLEQAIRSSFNFSRRGVRLDYARRLGDAFAVSGRYTFDRTKLFDLRFITEGDQLLIDRLFPRVRLSTLTGSVLRDTRDDVIDPARGSLVGTDVTFALRSIGSEVGFAKGFVQGFVYRRLAGAVPVTLVAGGRLGVAVGFRRVLDDGTVVDDVPVSERFFAGGDSTVRGFVLDRLGTDATLSPQGFPTGGSGLAVVNVEVRSPYWKGLGGVGFFDAGNVFRRAGDLSLGDLRPAAGAGLRYRSPLGPLRLDVGVNLDRQALATGTRERGIVFHLSLGQAF